MDPRRWTVVRGLKSLLCFFLPPRDLNFRELGFQFSENRLGHLFRCARAFDPFSTFEFPGIFAYGSQPRGHCVRIDGVLNPWRELFLDRASFSFNDDLLGNMFPIQDSVAGHGHLVKLYIILGGFYGRKGGRSIELPKVDCALIHPDDN